MSESDLSDKLQGLSEKRKKAENLSPEEIKERNRIALEKRKAAIAAAKSQENEKPLPAGWRRVESRSRPGEFVYENIHTEERQAWFPDAPAPEESSAPLVAQSDDEKKKEALKAKNLAALQKRKEQAQALKEAQQNMELPPGWRRVESRSRPGEFVYENESTGERQAWFPEEDPKKKELREKNQKALEAYKAKMAAKEDNARALPDGWRRVESRSRPGEFVYENIYTEERQAWFPDGPAEKPLPDGWRKVESRTYPGEFVYENVNTLERQAWRPDEPAPVFDKRASTGAVAAPPSKPVLCKAKALYDYTAENVAEEIDLVEGDIIAVEYKAANGWWVGINTRTQKNGIFPGTYVAEM